MCLIPVVVDRVKQASLKRKPSSLKQKNYPVKKWKGILGRK